MFVFIIKLEGKTSNTDEITKTDFEEHVLISEWDLANIIRILKSRNKTLYNKINKLYDNVIENVI